VGRGEVAGEGKGRREGEYANGWECGQIDACRDFEGAVADLESRAVD
jgi:hypothetical protein